MEQNQYLCDELVDEVTAWSLSASFFLATDEIVENRPFGFFAAFFSTSTPSF